MWSWSRSTGFSGTGITRLILQLFARIWNVDPAIISKGQPMPHAMQIFMLMPNGAWLRCSISCTTWLRCPLHPKFAEHFGERRLFLWLYRMPLTETAQRGRILWCTRQPCHSGETDIHQCWSHRPHFISDQSTGWSSVQTNLFFGLRSSNGFRESRWALF